MRSVCSVQSPALTWRSTQHRPVHMGLTTWFLAVRRFCIEKELVWERCRLFLGSFSILAGRTHLLEYRAFMIDRSHVTSRNQQSTFIKLFQRRDTIPELHGLRRCVWCQAPFFRRATVRVQPRRAEDRGQHLVGSTVAMSTLFRHALRPGQRLNLSSCSTCL